MSSYPAWVETKASYLATNLPRYESSWYGLWNTVLGVAMPPHEGFMVKPQSKVRPGLDVSEVLELLAEGGRLSFDSDGGTVASRGGGRESVGVPDFIVSLTNGVADRPVLIVEVKRSGQGLEAAERQLLRYMEAAAARQSSAFRGLLIAGPRARLYSIPLEPGRPRVDQEWCLMTGHVMYEALRGIARDSQPPTLSGPTLS